MRVKTLSKMLMLEQTLFGLTWVLASAVLPFADRVFAANFDWSRWERWVWLLVAFCSARSAGMAFNRLIDRHIDADNPRTQNRVLPSGEATLRQVQATAALGSLAFVGACWLINTPCLVVSPFILFLIWGYSYTKRFTSFCHFVMGFISGLAPVCAWMAITDSLCITPIYMGLALMASIAAMDIVYSLQDYKYDASHNLYSIPVALGQKNAIYLARALHLSTVVLLALTGFSMDLDTLYYVGVGLISVLLVYHHRAISPSRSGIIYQTFFACNTRLGLTMLLVTLGTVLWEGISSL